MPGKSNLAELNCSLAKAMNEVGDWWTLLIVRDAFFGVARFGQFQKSLGIARNILADRLERLVAARILRREGTRRRPIYRLTDKGRALLPALVALLQWGDAWTSASRPPVLVTDPFGNALAPIELRSQYMKVDVGGVRFVAGPGASARTRAFMAALVKDTEHD
jgi:DNA-binding HxlR family transcriptional regulator